jgi:CRP-like cAMP-binding protein
LSGTPVDKNSTLEQVRKAHAEVLAREQTRRIGAAPIFAGSSPACQRDLAASARLVHADDGGVVISEGGQSTSAYLIWSGAIQVENATGDVLGRFHAGELVGEVAAATGTDAYRFERTATARAIGPVDLYELPADSLKRLMEDQPVVRDRIQALIRDRITPEQMREHLKST